MSATCNIEQKPETPNLALEAVGELHLVVIKQNVIWKDSVVEARVLVDEW